MENPKLQDLLAALEPYQLKQVQPGKWRSRCPGHDGDNPTSLSISHDELTGKISLKCFAYDCSAEAILQPLGLEPKDLYMPQKMTPELRRQLAEEKAREQKKTGRAKLGLAFTAVNLGLTDEYEPGTKGTDRANAQRFVNLHGWRARYCGELDTGRYNPKSWFVWDGRRWERDFSDKVFRLADKVREAIDFMVAREEDEETRRQLRKLANSLERKATLQNMIETASKLLPITLNEFDQDPWLLNVNNGIIDLTTGERQPHEPGQFITKLCPVDYDPEARAPLWEAFLERIFNGNKNLIRFMQKAIGYALTGSTREQVVFFLYGSGRNGKSTLINTISAMLGDYAMHTPTSTLMSRNGEGVPNDIARLKGARFVSAVEAEDGKRLSEPFIKQISGGDVISARFMRGEWFDFEPQFKLFFATNHKPVIRGTDHAIWRRIRLIPFNVTITDDECDPDLPKKLLEELPGILNWAVEGCLLWQQEGLGLPDEVAQATESYRTEMDVLAGFIDDWCILNPLARVKKKDFYDAYCEWCELNGEKPLSQRRIGTSMIERGFTEARTDRARFWEGIGLANDTNDTNDTKSRLPQKESISYIANRKSMSDVSDVSGLETAATEEIEL